MGLGSAAGQADSFVGTPNLCLKLGDSELVGRHGGERVVNRLYSSSASAGICGRRMQAAVDTVDSRGLKLSLEISGMVLSYRIEIWIDDGVARGAICGCDIELCCLAGKHDITGVGVNCS